MAPQSVAGREGLSVAGSTTTTKLHMIARPRERASLKAFRAAAAAAAADATIVDVLAVFRTDTLLPTLDLDNTSAADRVRRCVKA
jgi:hypothetical protein